MDNDFRLKIFDEAVRKSFYLSKIDYLSNEVHYENDGHEVIVSLNDAVILLPTGINDSNNRQIYEGDIITYQLTSFTPRVTAYVTYENGCFLCRQILSK